MNTNPTPVPDPAWTSEEYKNLLDNCYPKLYSTAVAITKDPESAKDIVMRNFHKLLEGRSNIKPNRNPCKRLKTWVGNDSKSWLTVKDRSENRNEIFQKKYFAEPCLDVEEEFIRAEDYNLLYKEIEKLPKECSKVLKLDCDGLKIKEIAVQLNKKERTVRSHKARGVKLLSERLKGSDLLCKKY